MNDDVRAGRRDAVRLINSSFDAAGVGQADVQGHRRARGRNRRLRCNRIRAELAGGRDGELPDPHAVERKRAGGEIRFRDLVVGNVLETGAHQAAGDEHAIARDADGGAQRRDPVGVEYAAADVTAAAAKDDVAAEHLTVELQDNRLDVAVGEVGSER